MNKSLDMELWKKDIMDGIKEITDKITFISKYDPEGAARIEKLLGKMDYLKNGNAYRERFTNRQFMIVFAPLLEEAYVRARILETLAQNAINTIPGLSESLGIAKDRIFDHLKELMRRNIVEVAGHRERNPVFRYKAR